MGSKKEDTIYYDTLRSDEVECLKAECLRRIRRESPGDCLDDVNDMLSNLICCSGCCTSEEDINEAVIEVTELLINKGFVKKLFYQDISEEDAKKISEAMFIGVNYKYEEVDPYLLAAGLKMYCRDHLPFYLPQDVHLHLLYAYRDIEHDRKKEILKRVPFIMGEYHRLFFIQIFKLFKTIGKEFKKSETSVDNLLDIFAPLLIKDPSKTNKFNGFTKKQILKDLMKTDFTVVPKDFFSSQ